MLMPYFVDSIGQKLLAILFQFDLFRRPSSPKKFTMSNILFSTDAYQARMVGLRNENPQYDPTPLPPQHSQIDRPRYNTKVIYLY